METTLASLLRDERPAWPGGAGPEAHRDFLAAARQHGIESLVAARLGPGRRDGWPEVVLEALARAADEQRLLEEALRSELRQVLEELAADGLEPLLIKGAALAYRHYPRPHLRPRVDTDLLVQREEVAGVEAVMQRRGYRAGSQQAGGAAAPRLPFVKTDAAGVLHVYTFHWRLAPAEPFARLPRADELRRRAVPVTALGPAARAMGDADSLLLACVHMAAHRHDAPRLLWIYDIHLLAAAGSGECLAEATRAAVEHRVAAMCARGLRIARERLHAAVSEPVLQMLAAAAPDEASSAFLRPGRSQIDVLAADMRDVPGWSARGRLLRQHFFPPAAYMRLRYGVSSALWLPLLYGWRLCGAWRWFVPGGARRPGASA